MSAYDLAIATRNALAVPEIASWASTRTHDFVDPQGVQHHLVNHNKMLPGGGADYLGAIGFKTGYTLRSQHTLVAVATRERPHPDRGRARRPRLRLRGSGVAARRRIRNPGRRGRDGREVARGRGLPLLGPGRRPTGVRQTRHDERSFGQVRGHRARQHPGAQLAALGRHERERRAPIPARAASTTTRATATTASTGSPGSSARATS